MNTYIALLRGINVSGQKKIIMEDLRELFSEIGFTSVKTYIQSGNIIFRSNDQSLSVLEERIKEGILLRFGFDVSVLVITPAYLQSIYDNNPFNDFLKKEVVAEKKMYFTFLSRVPDQQILANLSIKVSGNEECIVSDQDKVVYFYAANGYGKTKLNNNFFEKRLNCKATTRNLNTIRKILALL